MKKFTLSAGTVVLAAGLAACGEGENTDYTENEGAENIMNNELAEENDMDNNDNNAITDNENNFTNNEENAENGNAGSEAGDDWYEGLAFSEFELDAEYEDGEYEAEYEYNDGNPEAEIEDTRDGNLELGGQEALDELEQILPQLELTGENREDEVFEAVLAAFDLEDDYDELEVEIEFFDGGETDAEDQ
ncbi:YusW family protein [Salipaludibacillus aurantiacus]|uniref:YusW-like protein n=1 Tax=Salipaludibacillus aurantiacus TaxID=1601833 RepID=A0A1H9WYI2_9BACI|nr:YusW family protein [Salipaludibacillus aurantiacus]SES38851.1 YusW-like protein [Salipaludibacillus aurantiacus]